MLIFLVGTLLGLIVGCAMCVHYLRQEISADIGPALKRVELQLDNIETQLNLAIMTRYAEFSSRPADDLPRQPPSRVDD